MCLSGSQEAWSQARPQTVAQAFPPLLRDLFDPPRRRRHTRKRKPAKQAPAAKPDGAATQSGQSIAAVPLPRPRPPRPGEEHATPKPGESEQAAKPAEQKAQPQPQSQQTQQAAHPPSPQTQQQANGRSTESVDIPRKKPQLPDNQRAQPAPPPAEAPPKNAAQQAKPDEPKPEDQKTAAQPSEPQPSACFTALQAVAVIKPLPSIHKGGCVADDVVSLQAVVMPDKRTIPLHPAATLRCPMAAEVSSWMRDDMAPLIATLGSPLKSIDNLDSFTCRGRNNVPGAKLSEHGKANAIDMRGFTLESGRQTVLTDPHVSREFRMATRETVCKRFHTVLGPGSDGYHEEHIHLDLEQRHNDYRICQWDVREPVERFITAEHVAPQGESGQHIGLIGDDAAAALAVDSAPAPAAATKKPKARKRRPPRSH